MRLHQKQFRAWDPRDPWRQSLGGCLMPGGGKGGGAAVTENIIAANRTQIPTAGAARTAPYTSRREHYAHPSGEISNLRLTYLGWYMSGAATTASAGYTCKSFIEYPAGTFTPVNAGADIVVPAGGQIEVTCGVKIPAGARFWERTVILTTGTIPALVLPAVASSLGGISDGFAASDLGNSGSMTGSNTSQYHGVSAIHADVAAAGARAAALLGDSLVHGQGDTTGTGAKGSSGFVARLIDAVMPSVKIAYPGQRASQFATLISGAGPVATFFNSVRVTDYVIEHGVNDLIQSSTQEALDTAYSSIVATILWVKPSAIIHQTTLTPRTGEAVEGTGWISAEAQVEKTDGTWSLLDVVNAATRARRSGISGQIIDFADAAMTARDSGIWGGPYPVTGDGTHPYTAKCAAMASSLAFSP